MTGSETILNRIKTDCDQKVNAIELEAGEKRKKLLNDAEAQAARLESEIADKTSRTVKRLEANSNSRCELERRNALLKRRRTEIDNTIKRSDHDNFTDLQRLPADFEQQVKGCGLDAAVSQTPADISGGFVLKSGDIEENMDFAAIISARRDELEDLINRELFAQ